MKKFIDWLSRLFKKESEIDKSMKKTTQFDEHENSKKTRDVRCYLNSKFKNMSDDEEKNFEYLFLATSNCCKVQHMLF